MKHLISVLFGALFTIVVAWSLGLILFRKLSLLFYKWEGRLLAFVAGSACLSAIMFVLSAAGLVHPGVLLVVGLASVAYAATYGAFTSSGKIQAALVPDWRWIFLACFVAFTYVGFFNALAPEHSSDGMAYHLGEVLKYQRAHGFLRITTDIYANLSEGVELIFLFAFEFGRHSAASLVHYAFLLVLVFLILSYGKRIGQPKAGAAAAIFTYACPVVLLDGASAYIDVALATVVFALFYLLQIWDERRDPQLLVVIGLLAGFCYEVKYTAFVAVPYALGFVVWKLWRAKQPILRPALVITAISVACIVPWMVKDWIEVANPVSPLANRLFPNPYVHISFEEQWRKDLSTYYLPSRWQLPLQATIQGDHVEGLLGPLFLLTPLALLALRYRAGRQLLLAAAIFGASYFGNVGTRFLIPVVPLISLALALALGSIPALLGTVVVLAAITCWPSVVSRYCAPGAYRIVKVPVRAALRLEPEDTYLKGDAEYAGAKMIASIVPANEPVFGIGQGGQSYLPRDLRVGYQSASNELLQDILWVPVVPEYQPTRILRFDFPPRPFAKLRVVQTAGAPDNQWSIAELRIFNGQTELARDPSWRLTAHPNPWDVQLAFDNSPVTRWRTWEPAAPGMYVEIDFAYPQTASAVAVESSDDTGPTKIKLEGMGADGHWTTISEHPVENRQRIRASLRMAATAEFKARGVNYIVIKAGEPGANDLHRYPAAWGIELVGISGDRRLFHIK